MAHADFEALLDTLIPFAKQMLDRYGEFFPFGAAVTTNGEIVGYGANVSTPRPKSQKLIDELNHEFRRSAWSRQIRAIGICSDMLTGPQKLGKMTDAICICLEHASGESIEAFLPYRKRFFFGIRYGEMHTRARHPDVFS